MKIWVDDIRTPPNESWYWAKDSEAALGILKLMKAIDEVPDAMSLDHDLGGDDTTRPVVLWMCDNNFWPVEVVVHSANPVGCDWLEGMIERYKP
jgi:hypothetical protein